MAPPGHWPGTNRDRSFIYATSAPVPAAPEENRLSVKAAQPLTVGLASAEPGYRLLFDANPGPMWVYDTETLRFLEVNEAALAQYDYSREQFLAMTILDIRPPEDVPAVLSRLISVDDAGRQGTLQAAEALSGVWRHRRRDGSLLDVEAHSAPVRFEGRPARLVLALDVTAQVRLEAALGATDDQLREAQALAQVGSWEWNIAGGQVRWSDELYRIFGLTPQAFPGTYDAYIGFVHPDDRAATEAAIQTTLHTGEPLDFEHRIVVSTGETRWLQCRGRLDRDGDWHVRMTGACQDITARREAQEALSRLALHDPLTGLPNRSLLMDRLTQGLLRLGRNDAVLGVLFVDLDRFKTINDRLGHAVGDQVLITVGARLRDVLRPHDTIARLGGDEFAVLCEDLVDTDAASMLAQRILDALEQPIRVADLPGSSQEITTSASIGIRTSARADLTADELLRDADMAMYRAKETGRNRIEVFDHSARSRNEARLRTAEELRRALELGQLRVFYQPEIGLGPMTPTGLEALARWQHPTRGLLGPAEFIQVAEDTGVIIPLGAWVVRQACRDLVDLDRTSTVALSMSINLSARQLGSPDLVGLVSDILAETGLDPGRLCFEITESILMDDVEFAIEALGGLRSLGVRLAIDDFGTGYSSLGYLRRFPVDVVKLDRAFVAGLGSDSAADAIVAAVINLAHALGLQVVAEGVETEQQLTVLWALRCDRAQGYHWSAPLPPEAVRGWLEAQPADLEAEPLDLRPLLSERISTRRAGNGDAGGDRPVILRTPASLATAFADAGAVRSVIDHLLSNAVKYSPADRPVMVSAASDRRWVRVSVADYGIGMTTEEANRCFEPFWQAEAAPDRSGTGVGLYIVRSLVEAMGGHVAVVSARGAGSTFTVALPRSARGAQRGFGPGPLRPGVGEDSSIREFMRQIGVPNRRGG